MNGFYQHNKGETPGGYSLNLASLRNWILVAALVLGVVFSGFSGPTTVFARSNSDIATASGQTSNGPVASASIISPSVTYAKTGPTSVKSGGALTYNLKITNSDPISYYGIIYDLYPSELSYTGPMSFTDSTTYYCFVQPLQGAPGIIPPNFAQIDVSDVGGIMLCEIIALPNSTVSLNVDFTASGPANTCFLNQSGFVYTNFNDIFPPNLKDLTSTAIGNNLRAIQNDTDPIYQILSNATTCFADTAKPPADLVAQLRVNPDHTAFIDPNTEIRYNLLVKNVGIGEANRATVTFPFDGNLDVGYLTSEDPSVWVSEVDTTGEQHTVTLSFPTIQPGGVYSATLVMRPSAAAVPGSTEFTRFTVRWDDAEKTGKSAGSNAVHFTLSDLIGSTLNLNSGEVQAFDPATVTVSNGSQQIFNANFFAPGELVAAWYTAPDGTSTSLGSVRAGDNGEISLTFSPVGLTAGDNYSISAYGNRSGVYGSATVTTGS